MPLCLAFVHIGSQVVVFGFMLVTRAPQTSHNLVMALIPLLSVLRIRPEAIWFLPAFSTPDSTVPSSLGWSCGRRRHRIKREAPVHLVV